MSDFVDLVNLSMQQEAALATNWIKDLETSESSAGHYYRPGCAQ